jgi:type II secretory pathway pseudopilin PulG
MNNQNPTLRRDTVRIGGFSPVETVGALSVIGMLAVSVLPPIFSMVNNSRLNGAAQSYMIVKTAAIRYLDQHVFDHPTTDLSSLTAQAEAATRWDSEVLRPAGFLDQSFVTKISERARLAISACPPAFASPTADNNAYSFSGFTPTANNTTSEGKIVVEAILEGVSLSDARALNRRIDGEDSAVGEAVAGTDTAGRVKYEFGSAKTAHVRVYVTHR